MLTTRESWAVSHLHFLAFMNRHTTQHTLHSHQTARIFAIEQLQPLSSVNSPCSLKSQSSASSRCGCWRFQPPSHHLIISTTHAQSNHSSLEAPAEAPLLISIPQDLVFIHHLLMTSRHFQTSQWTDFGCLRYIVEKLCRIIGKKLVHCFLPSFQTPDNVIKHQKE